MILSTENFDSGTNGAFISNDAAEDFFNAASNPFEISYTSPDGEKVVFTSEEYDAFGSLALMEYMENQTVLDPIEFIKQYRLGNNEAG